MPQIRRNRRPYKPPKLANIEWNSFRRGVNNLLLDTELGPEEVKELTNLQITGKGIIEPRPGTGFFHKAAASGRIRALKGFYGQNSTLASGANELLAISDAGFLTKKNGASYSIIQGFSYPSGYNAELSQLNDLVFISNGKSNLTRYNGATIQTYGFIGSPSMLSITKSSGTTTGTFTRSYRVSAESDVGETLAAQAISLGNLPETLNTTGFLTINWAAPSAASGAIKGYVIYGRNRGDEAYLARVSGETTSWVDTGTSSPSLVTLPPTSNTTQGPIAAYQIVHQERLVLLKLEGNVCRVAWSGGGTYVDKFHYSKGGGYRDINLNAGEEITGGISQEDRIIVFFTRSIFEMRLTYNETLGIVEPTVKRISGAVGAASHRTIKTSENEIAFIGRRPGGAYSLNFLGYEPNFTASVLRTSEISPRIRAWFETLNAMRIETDMWCIYYKNAYFMFGPVGANEWSVMVYDRERLAFYGPWTITDAACGEIYYDTSEAEHLLFGKTDGNVIEMSEQYSTDEGEEYSVRFLTKKEDWNVPFTLKFLKDVFFAIRNPIGNITLTVYIEEKDGRTTAAKNFPLNSQDRITPAGWGSFAWGSKAWGYKTQASTNSTSISDVKKYLSVYKPNVLTAQIGITGTGVDFKLLALKMRAQIASENNVPSSFRSNS